jgi:hypothetical protein
MDSGYIMFKIRSLTPCETMKYTKPVFLSSFSGVKLPQEDNDGLLCRNVQYEVVGSDASEVSILIHFQNPSYVATPVLDLDDRGK